MAYSSRGFGSHPRGRTGARRPYQEPRLIGDLLPGILRGLRPKNRRGLARIQEAWVAVAGEKTAARSKVTSLEGGVLRIELQSAALKHHLATFRSAELLEELLLSPFRALFRRPPKMGDPRLVG